MEKEKNSFNLLEASFEEIGNSDLTFKNTNISCYTDIEDAEVNPSLGGDVHSDGLIANKFSNRLSEGFLSSIKSSPMVFSSVPDNENFLDSSVRSFDKYGDTLFNLCSGNVEEELFDEKITFQSAFLEDSKNSECSFFDANIFHPKEEGLAFNFEYGIDQKETGIGNIGELIFGNGILNTESISAHRKFDVDIETVQSNLGIENEYSFDAFHSYNNMNGFLVDANVNIFPKLISDSIEEEPFKKNRNLDVYFSAFEADLKHGLTSEKYDYCGRFIEELTEVDESLVEIYKGVIQINSLKPADYKRHVADGLRELISHTIRFLLPDDNKLKGWLIKTNRKQLLYKKNGKLVPNRKAKLIYIFRDQPKRERKLAEKEADCINRLYHILNKPTHKPKADIPSKLLENYLEKVKNHLRTIILLYNQSR